MKIALIGTGKMGRAVQEIAEARGHHCSIEQEGADVAIDFTSPGAVLPTAKALAERPLPWVVGTTGWNKEEIFPIVKEGKIPFLYASNFSIGMALFRILVREGAHLFREEFQMRGVETHHMEKKDAPSGSALRLMEEAPGLEFESIREKDIVGKHQVFFESAEEVVELSHTAHSRKGFALGAVISAEFLVGKEGIYTFEDVIRERYQCFKEPSLL